MNRGKKQSPFIGRRVPLVDDGAPILYPRYRDVSDVLLDGASQQQQPAAGGGKKRPAPEQPEQPAAANGHAAPAAAAAAATAAPEQPSKKKSKKEKQLQQQPEAPAEPAAAAGSSQVTTVTPAVTPADESDDQHALRLRREEKARKKQEKQAKRAAELAAEAAAAAAAAGNGDSNADQGKEAQQQQQQQAADAEADRGNAEEAARIRSVLGFTAAADGSTAAAAAAAAPAAAAVKVPPPSSGFTFNFGGLSGLPTEARVAAETEAKLAAIQAVTAADKDGCVPRRVFVGGMPYSYSREQVAEYWGWCGEIESLDCMTFPDTGRFRGIAFITFASQQAADSALQYDGEQVEGQTLKVERCKAAAAAKHMKVAATVSGHQQRRQQQQHNADDSTEPAQPAAAAAAVAGGSTPAAGPGKTAGYNVAYVGNIAFEAGPDDLKALFAECGVTKVRLHTDKASGKSKGYAHLHFADDAGLDRALALSGSQVHGRSIKVSYGQPKKN